MPKTIPLSYSQRTVWIHWITALLIFALIFTGINMESMLATMEKVTYYRIHAAMGFAVFILTLVRVMALINDPRPEGLYPAKSLHQRFINIVHYGFYGVIAWMCISGLASIFVEEIVVAIESGSPKSLPNMHDGEGMSIIMLSHHIVAKIVMALLAFHIIGFVVNLIQKGTVSWKRIWK